MQSYSGVQGKRSDGILLNKPIRNQQAKQMDNDALAILEDKAVIATGLEGMKDIHIIQAIIASAESKQAVEIGGF